jgi:hypothetical protein
MAPELRPYQLEAVAPVASPQPEPALGLASDGAGHRPARSYCAGDTNVN